MQKVFTNLTIKAVNEDEQVIEGIASTARRDLAGDIVMPAGVEYDLPIPFCLDHDTREVVGEVIAAEVTASGIRFRAQLPKISQPGPAKDLVARAWDYLKHGLRKSVSIGFIPLQREPLHEGGWRYTAWRWTELSAVAVPCNPDAKITATKRAPGGGHIVGLSESERRRGKIEAEVEREAARRKRLGIPTRPVHLSADDLVAARLAARRAKRALRSRQSGSHVVRYLP